MYLGEITRNILLALIDASPTPLLFGGKSTKQLNAHYGLDTAVMSAVEEAWEGLKVHETLAPLSPPHTMQQSGANGAGEEHWPGAVDKPALPALTGLVPETLAPAVRARLEAIRDVVVSQLGLAKEDVSLQDAAVVRWACALVAGRAAKLSGCAVAAVLVQTGHATLGGSAPYEGPDKLAVGVDGRWAFVLSV